jgi:hypothetical protein
MQCVQQAVQLATYHINILLGHTMAQVVSHWLLTTEPQVRAQVSPCEICGGQSTTGTSLLRVTLS